MTEDGNVKRFKVNNNCNNQIFFHFDPNGNLKNRVDEPQQKNSAPYEINGSEKEMF